jgi:hypothetical protein
VLNAAVNVWSVADGALNAAGDVLSAAVARLNAVRPLSVAGDVWDAAAGHERPERRHPATSSTICSSRISPEAARDISSLRTIFAPNSRSLHFGII